MGSIRKPRQRKKARKLRREGESLKVIARACGVSPGTVKLWTDDIYLTPEQKKTLEDRWRPGGKPENFRLHLRRRIYEQRLRHDRDEAFRKWKKWHTDRWFLFGLALYIGEGDKTGSRIGLTNSDPAVLKATLRFFQHIGCDMPRIRVHIVLHQGENPTDARNFWSRELGIPTDHFNKVTPSKRSGGNRARKLPHGTASVRVGDASLKRQLDYWMRWALGVSAG